MAAYELKNCPHCGAKYEGLNYKGVQFKDSQMKYGSPLKLCPVCKKEFLDKNYREIAVEGIRDEDMECVSAKVIFYGIVGIAIGIGAVYYEMYGGIIAVLLGIFILASEMFSHEKRQKELEADIYRSCMGRGESQRVQGKSRT